MKISQGTPDEIGMALLPMNEVIEEIATSLHATGKGKHCGDCGKPFNAARKYRAVVRVTHLGESGLMLNTWLLCGKCYRKARRNGGKVPIQLTQEARQSYEDMRLTRENAGAVA